MIEEFIQKIPQSLLDQPGGVFYSGKAAFTGKKDLYILGLNPGGSPDLQSGATVAKCINNTLQNANADWSAYRDECWEGTERPGTWGMQPRVLHLLAHLGLNPGETPSSNIVFVQSRREAVISNRLSQLAEDCWPFHKAVIEKLNPKLILCFGKTAGNFVKKKLDADKCIDEFIEKNNRNWKSQVFLSKQGIKVAIATHPSIADWTAPATDPSEMIKRAIS